MFTRLNGKEVILTPKNIYKLLIKQEKNYPSTSFESDPNSPKIVSKDIPESATTCTYPSLRPTQNRKTQTYLSDRKYTELILIAFEAYINVYHVKEIETRLCNREGLKEMCENMVAKRAECKNQPKQTVKIENLKKNYKRLRDKELKNAENAIIVEHNSIDIESFGRLTTSIDICVDQDFVLAYRQSLKYLGLIKTSTHKLQNIRKDFERYFTVKN